MKISIKYVKNAGELSRERIVLKMLQDDNIGNYLLSDTTSLEDNQVSSHLKHIFWIPDQVVHHNDLIVIYTKKGSDRKKINPSGTTTYFFYWGLEKAIWDSKAVTALVINIFDWETKAVDQQTN